MALKIIPKLLWHRGKLSKFFMALRKFVLFIFLFRLENLTAAGNWKEYSWTDRDLCNKKSCGRIFWAARGLLLPVGGHGDPKMLC
jgi:hypothetical protein